MKKVRQRINALNARLKNGELTLRTVRRLYELKRLLDEGVKTCKYCGETLPIEEFYVIAQAYDGYSGDCRNCRSSLGSENYRKRVSK